MPPGRRIPRRCSGLMFCTLSVSRAAGATLLASTPVPASSLASDLVKAITPAFEAE